MTATARSTGWFNVTEAYPAVADADAIGFIVYASNVPAGKGFDADLMSLTGPVPTTGDSVKPAAPTSVTATAKSQTQIDLAWTAATDNVGVTGYTVQRGGRTGPATTASTTFADTGLTAGTSSATRSSLWTRPATPVRRARLPQRPHPYSPHRRTFMLRVFRSTEVDLTWTSAAGATGYTIQRDGTAIGTTTATQFADTTVNASSSYAYIVIAADNFAGSAPSATFRSTPATAHHHHLRHHR